MAIKYVIKGFHAFSELDNWEDGCQIDSSKSYFNDEFYLSAASMRELIAGLIKEFNATDINDFLFDSCEELGRLELQVMQRVPFVQQKPSNETIKKWKSGKIDLYLTCYMFYVTRIEDELSLTETFKNECRTEGIS